MKVLSLFDGISCGYVALKRAGIKVDKYYASEIDKYAIQVAKKNHPDIIHIGDVLNVNKESVSDDIDLLIGGSPCTGFSFAGKKLNFDDPQSKLFFEYIRIMEEFKPKYFLFENVIMKKEWVKRINEIFEMTPIQINSNLVSAQNRNRLYWTNIPVKSLPKDKGILLSDVVDGEGYLYNRKQGLIKKIDKSNPILASDWRGLNRNQNQTAVVKDGEIRKLTPEEAEVLQTLEPGYTSILSHTQRYKTIGNGWTVDVIVHILKGLT